MGLEFALVELVTAFLFWLLFKRFGFSAEFGVSACTVSILVAVFFIDLKHHVIPNEMVAAGLAVAAATVFYSAAAGRGLFGNHSWTSHLLGLLPGSGILFGLALMGALVFKKEDLIGMGDIKLFAPLGLILGWRLCAFTLLLSTLAAGLAGLVLLILGLKKKNDLLPMGPFISAAALAALILGEELIGRYAGF